VSVDRYEARLRLELPEGKYSARAREELSSPRSPSAWDTSCDDIVPELERSRTENDSRMVWRCWGGRAENGSLEFTVVVFDALGGNVDATCGLLVMALFESEKGMGDCDLVGSCGDFIQDLSVAGVVIGRLVDTGEAGCVCLGVPLRLRSNGRMTPSGSEKDAGADCFKGEPPFCVCCCGVDALTVDGDFPRGDSGRRKGEGRDDVKDRLGPFVGLAGLDWVVSMLQ
jgi:hypothetical protein